MEQLRRLLDEVEGRPYGAYKRIKGRYRFADFTLAVDHVQGDPFAAPSRLTLEMPMATAQLPEGWWQEPMRRLALEDYLARCVAAVIREVVRGHRGSGKSGEVAILPCGQEVLRRNSVAVTPDGVEARITVGLPAAGRRCLGREAAAILLDELPQLTHQALTAAALNATAVEHHLDTVEDHQTLQGWLAAEGLVAFVADGSVLPRASGINDRPLGDGALPFRAPDSLAREVVLPHAGRVRGMALPAGVTLIVGGGFHGKSTLLKALERGVYPHCPGDGRERVATDPTAVKVRAEDGRAVSAVDIRPFIDRLPLGRDCARFTTDNGSGSTSQAASIIEALAVGGRCLLIDEDTSATNFMIRDDRMQQLVARDQEPITPFIHRVRELYEAHGVSTVVVMGGSGDYFEVADTVVQMEAYRPADVTAAAHALAGHAVADAAADLPPLSRAASRRPDPATLSPAAGRRPVKIAARDRDRLLYGTHEIDLSRVEQLVDPAQARAIGHLIHHYATHHGDAPTLTEGLADLYAEIDETGLDPLTPYREGTLALPRLHEVAAALNRMRGVQWLA